MNFSEDYMRHITVISFALLCSAVPKTLTAGFSDDAAIPFISPDDASAGGFEIFGDSSGDFTEDIPDLQLELSNISSNLGFDASKEDLGTPATTFALEGCSGYNDQQLGRRIRVRAAPALCPVQPKTGSDPQTNSNGNSNGNGNDDDLMFKNNDGIQTEPKDSAGLNRYGTNSDGTICAPDMWLLCSSIELDMEGSCLGCYPCEFFKFATTLVSYWGNTVAADLHSDLFIYFSGLVHCAHPRRVLCCEDYNYIVSV